MGDKKGAGVEAAKAEVTDMKLKELAEAPLKHPELLPKEKFWFGVGMGMLLTFFPLTVVTVASTVVWDALDRGFMGKPQDGIAFIIAKWINKVTAPFGAMFVKNKEDAFIVNVVLLLGVALPAFFFWNLWYTLQNGFTLKLCFAYHVLRLGPYFMNFAYVYTNCHKECHNHVGVFKKPYHYPLQYVFNWWIGLFYGVIPSSFAFGHAINHHKYNNGPKDVISTADKPRDSGRNFICYIPRQFLYAINISTVHQFIEDKEYDTAFKMVVGTVWYIIWVYAFWLLDPMFAVAYVLFPLGENVLLLACINWCWHAFLNHEDPEDEYVGSVTLLNGPINVQGEDYHVIHHKYPGVHWTTHQELFDRDMAEGNYKVAPATMFKDSHVFEIFFLVILRQYDELANRMVDPRGIWTHQDKINACKTRLRTCWWGPRFNLNIKLEGKEIRK
eukprot:TRINITY_DN325_c0_g3_i1.p2 TRINITY_DN325_c0_g3~~TRINITY_DN325_c0_g3_i1.p2  ORF type:complete len:460 (+),score=163.55 TRINITY_DN325_c0_g3_i1:53-1381(+)